LKTFDLASELDNAAATPSSTSSVIKISDCEICATDLIYADASSCIASVSTESNGCEHRNV